MSEIRIKYLDAKNASPAPCYEPFTDNRYRDEATGDLVLPDGWTPAVVNYYLTEHPKRAAALKWLATARIEGTFNRLVPSLTLRQVEAWIASPPV